MSNEHNPLHLSFFYVVFHFVKQTGLGFLIGYFFSAICKAWLKRVAYDFTMIINIVVCGSYLVFYFSEIPELQVSGILALTVLGLRISKVEHVLIRKSGDHQLHSFLKYAEFCCETIIFFGVGLFIGENLFHNSSTIELKDWINTGLLFFVVIIARFIAIGIYYPLLKSNGYGMNVK